MHHVHEFSTWRSLEEPLKLSLMFEGCNLQFLPFFVNSSGNSSSGFSLLISFFLSPAALMDSLLQYSLNDFLKLQAHIRNLTTFNVTKKNWLTFWLRFLFCFFGFSTISLELSYSLRTRVLSHLVLSLPVFSCLSRTPFLNDSNLGIFEKAKHIVRECSCICCP